jgi:hypothetical protein
MMVVVVVVVVMDIFTFQMMEKSGWGSKLEGMDGRMDEGEGNGTNGKWKGNVFLLGCFGGLIDTMLCGGHGIEKYGKMEGIFSWSFHEKKVKMDGKIL